MNIGDHVTLTLHSGERVVGYVEIDNADEPLRIQRNGRIRDISWMYIDRVIVRKPAEGELR